MGGIFWAKNTMPTAKKQKNSLNILRSDYPKSNILDMKIKTLMSVIFSKSKSLDRFNLNKKQAYLSLSALDLLIILIVLICSIQPASQMVSPLVSSLQTINSNLYFPFMKTTPEVFSFAPGSSTTKFSKMDLEGLNILSFFDVPVNGDGSLNQDSVGYENFKGEKAGFLFEEAKFKGTKVLLTLTQSKAQDFNSFILDNSAQQELINQVIEEVKISGIDGVTINFEPKGNSNPNYKNRFSQFVDKFSTQLHQAIPNSQLAVAIPSSKVNSNYIYDLAKLSQVSDRVLVVADDFIVPEENSNKPQNPVYGYDQNQYWQDVSDKIHNFLEIVPEHKLVLERAWYGNGDKYPLYIPTTPPPQEDEMEPAHVLLDNETVDRLARNVPIKARQSARKNIPLIGKALQDEGILDSNVLAYALATIEHETAGTFEPISEYSGNISARRLGYEGGTNYYGRGFIQLTHLRNYKKMGERIGMGNELAQHPELASTPEVAAKILAAFFKDNNISNLASKGKFVAARTPINPDSNGWMIAEMAWKYEGGAN